VLTPQKDKEKTMPKWTGTTAVPFPADQIDLEAWLWNMSDQDYQGTARQHKALGVYAQDGMRGMVNVEVMGHTLMIQHYHDVTAGKSYLELYSVRSRAYLFHIVPVTVQVRWTMSVTPLGGNDSSFSCTVDTTMPPVIHVLAAATGVLWAIRRHIAEETIGYAADLTRKLQGKAARLGPDRA
jgi:hypothetical protein